MRPFQTIRPFMLLAVSAIALSSASLGQANAGTSSGAADLRDAAAQLRITEPIARVCREICRENVCRTRCINIATVTSTGIEDPAWN